MEFDFREKYILIANELYYPEEVINKLRNAKTEIECANILTSARRGCKWQ